VILYLCSERGTSLAIEGVPNGVLRGRLNWIAEWAEEQKVFRESEAKELTFRVTNRVGQRLWYFYGSGKSFVGLAAKCFDGDERAGVALGHRLQRVALMAEEVALDQVQDGRYFS